MEERSIAGIDINSAGVCTIADLKLRVAEHVVAQYDYRGVNDVWDIIAETKVGARRKPTLLKILKKVFSAA